MQCTDEEIAAWFGVDRKTIEHRRKVPKFAQIMERGRAKGRISVRRQQMKLLDCGNGTMGIWLGKQLLGQTDHFYHDINGSQIHIVCPVVQGPQRPRAEEYTAIDISREPAGYLNE